MKLTYSELENSNNGGSFLAKAANGAKGAVCGAYHDYKDWYHSNINAAAPAGVLIEQLWDNLCPLEPPYSPPSTNSPFNGGQCQGVEYRVEVEFHFYDIDFSPPKYDSRISYSGGYYQISSIKFAPHNGAQNLFVTCAHYNSPTAPGGNIPTFQVDGRFEVTIDKISVFRLDGLPDNCGNPPANNPPPLTPPPIINRDITIDNKGTPLTIPFSFNPQFSLPGLSINGNLNIFKPEVNLSLSPQFDIKPNFNLDVNPKVNLQFDLGGVNINVGGSPDNDTVNNVNNNNNVNNINNNVNNVNNNVNNINNTVNNIENNTDKTNDDVTIIKDKLACNPCDLLKEIKDKLFKIPTYRAFPIAEFQSIKRDNLADLGFIEIDLTKQPTKTKIIFGGNAPNVMFAGWITWRKNGYNFSREQVTAEKSIYLAPKGANGFSICCTHNARANCIYYIEIKD